MSLLDDLNLVYPHNSPYPEDREAYNRLESAIRLLDQQTKRIAALEDALGWIADIDRWNNGVTPQDIAREALLAPPQEPRT